MDERAPTSASPTLCREDFDRIIQLDAQARAFRAQGRLESAAGVLHAALALASRLPIGDATRTACTINLADNHMERGEHVAAEALALDLLAALPASDAGVSRAWIEARSVLCNAYMRALRHDKAEQTVEETIAALRRVDPTSLALVPEYDILHLIYKVTGREHLTAGVLQRMEDVRARALAADPAELAKVDDAIESVRQRPTVGTQTSAEVPRTQGEADAAVHACWSAFIVRDHALAGRWAHSLLHSSWSHPRWLLVWITATRSSGRAPDVDEVLAHIDHPWLKESAGVLLGRANVDAALAAAESDDERCMTRFYAGMSALHHRDGSRAAACFRGAIALTVDVPECRQAMLELEALGHQALPASELSETIRRKIDEAMLCFASWDLDKFLVSAHELMEVDHVTPDHHLRHVAGYLLLGMIPLSESIANLARKQLLDYPWHERLLDLLAGRVTHHRLWDEAGGDQDASAQVAYYGMLRMQAEGRWEEAEFLRQRVLASPFVGVERRCIELTDAFLSHHADGLQRLAVRQGEMGRFDLAESTLRAEIGLLERLPGASPATVGAAHLSMATVQSVRGRPGESLASIARARGHVAAMNERMRALLDLVAGQVLLRVSDRRGARHRLTDAREVLDRLPDEGTAMLAALDALGALEMQSGSVDEAIRLQEQALSIIDRTPDSRPIIKAIHLDHLGTYLQAHDVTRSVALHREAREIVEELLAKQDGPLDRGHPFVSTNLANLATALFSAGDDTQAGEVARRGLPTLADSKNANDATTYQLKRLLASVALAAGRPGEALDWLLDAAASADQVLGETMALGDEELRMHYLLQVRVELADLVPLGSEHFAEDPVRLERIFDVVLRRKCLAGESAIVLREAVASGRYPLLRRPLADLAEARERLAMSALSMAGSSLEGQSSQAALRSQVRALESALAKEIPELQIAHRLGAVRIRDLVEALHDSTTLVEFVRTESTRLRSARAMRASGVERAHYYAFVVPQADLSRLRLVDLGDAAVIEEGVRAFVAAVGDPAAFESQGGSLDPFDTRGGHGLRARIFDPIGLDLSPGGPIVLAADGALAQLPFELLPAAGGGLLMDHVRLSYVATLRDLGARPSALGRGGPAVVVGDPDFDLGVLPDPDPQAAAFRKLPGTREEAISVAAVLGVAPWLGGEVLKSRLKRMASPRILHLATHGFYASDKSSPEELTERASRGFGGAGRTSATAVDTMHRSGLALAGANAQAGGDATSDAGDGLLTAAEAVSLDLRNTELVVLSACETGLGAITFVEGVMGLRRAFLLAGARSVLVSLWPVPDEPTNHFMRAFYGHLLQGATRLDALQGARDELRRQWYPPNAWGSFVLFGETGHLRRGPPAAPAAWGSAKMFMDAGIAMQQDGRHGEACRAFVAALQAGGPSTPLLLRIARSYDAVGERSQALELVDRVLASEPNAHEAWLRRAALNRARKDWHAARDDCARAIALDPADADSWYQRANCHAELGDHDGAFNDYTRAIELDRRFEEAWVNRGTLRMGRGEWVEALVDLQMALSIDPHDVLALFHVGQAHAQLGSFQKARALLEPISRSDHIVAEMARHVLADIDARGEDV